MRNPHIAEFIVLDHSNLGTENRFQAEMDNYEYPDDSQNEISFVMQPQDLQQIADDEQLAQELLTEQLQNLDLQQDDAA